MELKKRQQNTDFNPRTPLPDQTRDTGPESVDAPPVPPTSWPGSQLLQRARTFWRDSLVGPAKRMTARELGIALGIGVWGGLFLVPSATTAVVDDILALARLAGVKNQDPTG